MAKKIILGLVGEIASGKNTVADYLKKKHKGQTISFSEPLREVLDLFDLPITRDNMCYLGEDMRGRFGQDILSKSIAKKIKKSKAKLICLPNIRLETDIIHLKKIPGFVLVNIKAKPRIRYKRLIKRHQNDDDKTKTWTQFQKDAKLPTEVSIRKIARRAKYKIDNNGSLEELYKQVEELLKKITPVK